MRNTLTRIFRLICLAALRDITLVFIMKVNVIVKVKIDVATIILIILRFIVIHAILRPNWWQVTATINPPHYVRSIFI